MLYCTCFCNIANLIECAVLHVYSYMWKYINITISDKAAYILSDLSVSRMSPDWKVWKLRTRYFENLYAIQKVSKLPRLINLGCAIYKLSINNLCVITASLHHNMFLITSEFCKNLFQFWC